MPSMPVGAPRITRIVVSKPGRRLLVVFIVLGIIVTAGNITVAIVSSGQSSEALRNLDRDYATVVRSSQQFGAAVQSCGLSGGPDCVHAADRDLADAVRRFHRDLGNERFPAYALSTAGDLRDDATQLAGILDQMVATSDTNTYRTLAQQFQTSASQLDADYRTLHDLLDLGG
jgi:hypothetical protein